MSESCGHCGRDVGCNCEPLPPRECECCGYIFPEGDGHLGDFCPECNWECDLLEECEGCGGDDYSSANHACLSAYREKRAA